ncbi:hypothetical protein MKEN_00993200 [Mycena kentingensis (nom. inval.)]|nr:hypothetical protein MKEN_00993200 [Mycena kentingensis (nom. inval.)]
MDTIPSELLHQICGELPHKDLTNASLTGRRFYACCMRILYRTPYPATHCGNVKLLQTLARNPRLASHVRELCVELESTTLLQSIVRVCRAAMSNLSRVSHLLLAMHPSLFAALADVQLPQLVDCDIPSSPAVCKFLEANPRISRLQISESKSHLEVAIPSPVAPLQWLKSYTGPAAFALALLPRSQVSDVAVTWPRHGLTVEHISAVLCAASEAQVAVTKLASRSGYQPELLRAISAHLPNLTVLMLRMPVSPNDERYPDLLAAIETTISQLPSLVEFCFRASDRAIPQPDTVIFTLQDLDEEFALIRHWGVLCPSLNDCCITETQWLRSVDAGWDSAAGRDSVWYPRNLFNMELLLRHRLMALRWYWWIKRVVSDGPQKLPQSYRAFLDAASPWAGVRLQVFRDWIALVEEKVAAQAQAT